MRPSVKWAKPQEWKSGAAMCEIWRVFRGSSRQQRHRRLERLRVAARGALGRAGRAAREDDDAALALWRHDLAGVARPDQLVERRVGAVLGVVPRDEALAPLARLLEEARELLVVDQRAWLLALRDLGELGGGERRVEVERVRPELRDGDRRLDEAAVVAAHDPDAVPLDDAGVGERVGERVRAHVDLGVAERPELVDDHRVVRVARRERDRAGGRAAAPALQRPQEVPQPVRPHRPDHAGVREHLDVAELVRHLPGQPPDEVAQLMGPLILVIVRPGL